MAKMFPDMPVAPFTEADVECASDEWGVNCGPSAVAAIMGMGLDAVRPMMGDFETKHYTNPTLMWDVLKRIGRPWRMAPLKWPAHGLVRIQWHGSWMNDGVPIAARYRHTHWVAAQSHPCGTAVFDINAMVVGGWIPLQTWETELVPHIIKHLVPRGNGAWSMSHAVEVDKQGEAQ